MFTKLKIVRLSGGKTRMAVPGEGNPDADVIFIGEAPGKKKKQRRETFYRPFRDNCFAH